MLQLKNFSNKSTKESDYVTMQKLCICGSGITLDRESIYNNPATYSSLSGIKYLEVSGELAKITEQEDIDWYEYFPDLETLEVITEEDN